MEVKNPLSYVEFVKRELSGLYKLREKLPEEVVEVEHECDQCSFYDCGWGCDCECGWEENSEYDREEYERITLRIKRLEHILENIEGNKALDKKAE